jgi:hypothetical protein
LSITATFHYGSSGGQTIDHEARDYLSGTYIEKLLKTKSPKASEAVEGTIAHSGWKLNNKLTTAS